MWVSALVVMGTVCLIISGLLFANFRPSGLAIKLKGRHFLYALTAFYWAQLVFTFGFFIVPFRETDLIPEALGILLLFQCALLSKAE